MVWVCRPLHCQWGCCMIKQRYVLAIILHFALMNAYQVRIAMTIALTEITQHKNGSQVDVCPQYHYDRVEVQGMVYDWPNWVEAMILYSFYIGSMVGHLPGGWLADRFGGRPVMGGSLILSALLTWEVPKLISLLNYYGAVLSRFLLGLAQGPIFPAVSSFMQNWVPHDERGTLGGIAFAGSNLGTFIGGVLTGYQIEFTETWYAPFYIWSVVIFCWYALFLLMAFSRPSTHPFITEEEREYLKTEIEERKKSFKVPWGSLITSLPVWALFWGQWGHNFITFTMVCTLPKYNKEIFKLDVSHNAIYSTLPFLCLWAVSIIAAFFSRVILDRSWMSLLALRKWYTVFGNVVPCIFILIATYVGCNRVVAITLFTIGVAMQGPFFSGMKVNVNDITRYYSGIIMAWANGIGASGGVLGIFLVGYITTSGRLEEWELVFWIMLTIGVSTSAFYYMFAEAERQHWDFPEET